MKIKILNLKDPEVRRIYSYEMTKFEDQFDYPLGDKRFFIKHGFQSNDDYFSFFEQMGEVYYFIVEEKDILIGAGCAILRTINRKKVWYLCDFKVSKAHRGRKILERILIKYFIPLYLKSQKMMCVNMSHPNKNGLLNKIKKMFSWFKVEINELYFFEWTKAELLSSGFDYSTYLLIHNKGRKDIVIDGRPYPIYHLVDKQNKSGLDNFQTIQIDEIHEYETIMWCSQLNNKVTKLMITKQPSTIGSIMTYGFKDDYFSSSEI